MAKPITVICKNCKEKINKDTAYNPALRQYFCDEDCYKEWSGTDDGLRDAFIDYIWNLYDEEYRVTSLYMTIRKQAEYYHKQYNMKYKGMLLAAKYHIDTLEKKWYNEYGLGQLLPTAYEEVKEQYENQKRLKQKLDKDILHNEERIVVARKQPIRRKMLELE